MNVMRIMLVMCTIALVAFWCPINPSALGAAEGLDEESEWEDLTSSEVEEGILESESIVRNGSFEAPIVPPEGTRFPAGSTIGAWHVSRGNVDLLGDLWNAARGKQSLDLSGSVRGAVFQRLRTVPGQAYQISFFMAGNPDGLPQLKRMRVVWGGQVLANLSFNTLERTRDKMGWELVQLRAVATATTTRLKFLSLTNSPFGPMVDAVEVEEELP